MDPAKNRRVYGVPVFPGPSSGGNSPAGPVDRPPTAPRLSPSDSSSSPSALEAGQNGLGPAAAGAPGGGKMHWKLRHIDFVPNIIKGKKEDEFERFP